MAFQIPLLTWHRQPEAIWLWREAKPFVPFHIGAVVCTLIVSAIGLCQPLVMKWLIDDILPNQRWGALMIVSGTFLAAGVTRAVLGAIGSLWTAKATTRMTHRIRVRLSKRLLSLSPFFHARHPTGELLQRVERDVGLVGELGAELLPALARVLGEIVMAAALMFYLDWRLAAVVFPLLPLFAYARRKCQAQLRGASQAVRAAHGRQSSLLQEVFNGVAQIQLLGAERRTARQHTRLSLEAMHREIELKHHELVFTVISTGIMGLGIAGIVQYGGMRVLLGGMSVGGLVAFYGYIGAIVAPIGTVGHLFSQVIRVGVSVRRVLEIEQTEDPIRNAPDAVPLHAPPQSIVCQNVSLSYGSVNGDRVLRNVHFRAKAGERVAVVGLSGSGKSSLLKLIPRLYDASEGSIEVDGRDVRSLQIESLRKAVSFVPQDPTLFQGTIRANVRGGSPRATSDDLEYAAWLACLTDVIRRLPNGWDTELGPNGSGLSGGERQRVALARALLQRRPILILDEAASALDGATEQLVLSRLDDWCDGRIVIVVSHRRAAARWADRVVVLRGGEVVEEASHDILARAGTHYDTLWGGEELRTVR